jgi:anti-sigma factor RsiW
MSHLTDEQLSALLDGALGERARADAGRHLEGCAECRATLAGLTAQDTALRSALEHDPGEEYFESFTARVGGRIRAAGLKGAQAREPEGRGLAEWFRSPRKLALLGAVATVVAGAGIVMLSTREARVPALREKEIESRVAQEAALPPQAAPPGSMGAMKPAPANAPTGTGGRVDLRDQAVSGREERARATPATGALVPPTRAQQVRRNEQGEDVLVGRPNELPQRAIGTPQPAPGPPGAPAYAQKQRFAQSMESRPKDQPGPPGGARLAPADEEKSAASPPRQGGAPALQAVTQSEVEVRSQREPATLSGRRICGTLLDDAGRPVAGAQVVDRASGAGVTSAADGSFCLESRGRTEIAVMAVGFQPVWRTMTAGQPQRIALQAVPVMGAPGTAGGLALTDKGQRLALRAAPDPYDRLPTWARVYAQNAQRLTALAEQVDVAPAWDSAAAEWERTVEALPGDPLEGATRFAAAHARVRAWRLGVSAKRATGARQALEGFLRHAPQGAQRDTAQRWLEELKR